MNTYQLIEKTNNFKNLDDQSTEADDIINEIKVCCNIQKVLPVDKKRLVEAVKLNIVPNMPKPKGKSYVKELETIISNCKYDPSLTYTDNINYKDIFRLEIMDIGFILEYGFNLPLTTVYKKQYSYENGNVRYDSNLYYLFGIGNASESREIFRFVKDGKISKLFDGKCKISIECGQKGVELMSYDQKPRSLPKFIIDHIYQTYPDLILKELLERRSNQLVANLIFALPHDEYISTGVGKEKIAYRYDKTTQLYEMIDEVGIRSDLMPVVLKYVKDRFACHQKYMDELRDSKNDAENKGKEMRKQIDKMKDPKQKKASEAELTKINNTIANLRISIETSITVLTQYGKLLRDLETRGFMDSVINLFIRDKRFFKAKFAEQLDQRNDVFNFKNGLMELRSGVFRPRTKSDYFTVALDYDYNVNCDKQILKKIDKIILQICNDDTNLAEQYKSWLGYSMTGEITQQRALWSIGVTAQNGKTTIIEAFAKMAHLYCVKLNSKTFDEKFQNKHKQLALVKCKRMVYLEEMERNAIDIQAYKDFVGARHIGGNEILYSTAESIRINFKLIFISNKFPKFKSDAGVRRRGYCIEHTNLFYDDSKYKQNKHKKGVYLRNDDLSDLFEQDDYKLAFFHLLQPYATRYYKSMMKEINMDSLKQTWENICCENDEMAQFIEDHYDITNNKRDCVFKEDFLKHYQQHYNLTRLAWTTLICDIRRVGLEYDRLKKHNGNRGMILGIVKKINNHDSDQIELLDEDL